MNRQREFDDLIHDIQSTAPKGLDTSVKRAVARAKKRRRIVNMVRIPAAALLTLALCFTVLVNTSATFARAVGRMPTLHKLALLAAHDPSLKAAVENEYVQPINETIVMDGLGISLYYVIADEQSLTAFFSIDQIDMPEDYYLRRVALLTMEDAHINVITSYPRAVNTGVVQQIRFNCWKGETLPTDMKIEFQLYRVPEEALGGNHDFFGNPDGIPDALPVEWTFELHLDPDLFQKGEVKPLDKWVDIGGQRVYLENLTIYPSQAKLNFHTDPANTAIITDLGAWLENGYGRKWPEKSDGIRSTTYRGEGQYEIVDFWMESPYFDQYDDLTLHIDQASLIPKDEMEVTVDYAAGTVSPLPDCVKLLSMEPEGGELVLSFEIGFEQGHPFWYETGKGDSIRRTAEDEHDWESQTRVFWLGIEGYEEPFTLLLIRVPREDIKPVEIEIK